MIYVVVNIVPNGGNNQAAPRARAELDGLVGRGGNGGTFTLSRDDKVDTLYTDEQAAEQAARALAEKRPGVQFAVMGIKRVFETTQPKVITKVLDNAGQLVPG